MRRDLGAHHARVEVAVLIAVGNDTLFVDAQGPFVELGLAGKRPPAGRLQG